MLALPPEGWLRLGPNAALAAWAAAAGPLAIAALAESPDPWRAGGTWHVGLDHLPNTPDGALPGRAFPWAALPLAPLPLHRAQVSAIRAGYPRRAEGETDAAFRYRTTRDAAHLDGLIAEGPHKRRFVREPHAWVLGLALNDHDPGAAPLSLWEGSHRIMQAALAAALAPHPAARWGDVDVTDAYAAARRAVFDECRRVEVAQRPGEAVILHRHLLHGMAPWAQGAKAPPEGRLIVYFRPVLADVAAWMAPG